MPKNWEQRDKKLNKRKSMMKLNSRGLITVTLPTLAKKAQQAKENSRG
jgi:hypothetical protein